VPLEVTVVNPSRQGHSPVFDRNGITVSAMAVPHANVPSIAYRVRTGQGTVVFGSDQSGENPHFAEFASNADVLVMHLTIGAGETLRGHASPPWSAESRRRHMQDSSSSATSARSTWTVPSQRFGNTMEGR